jgi:hypothetical protein
MTKFVITIKDNKTGKIKDIEYLWTGESSDYASEQELVEFIWEVGNMSCDCNRFSKFYPDSEECYPCGDERFTLIFIKEQ